MTPPACCYTIAEYPTGVQPAVDEPCSVCANPHRPEAPTKTTASPGPVNNNAMFMAVEKFLAKHLDGR